MTQASQKGVFTYCDQQTSGPPKQLETGDVWRCFSAGPMVFLFWDQSGVGCCFGGAAYCSVGHMHRE